MNIHGGILRKVSLLSFLNLHSKYIYIYIYIYIYNQLEGEKIRSMDAALAGRESNHNASCDNSCDTDSDDTTHFHRTIGFVLARVGIMS